jgi:hypothetical protein
MCPRRMLFGIHLDFTEEMLGRVLEVMEKMNL